MRLRAALAPAKPNNNAVGAVTDSRNKTVKIETFQNGLIQSGQFNFTDLLEGGWPTSIRLPGTFGEAQYELERDIYQDPSYREIQNRDQVTREFQFKSELIPESLTDRFATLDILGNQIIVTAYDVLQELKYEKFPVVGENFSDIRYDGLGRASFDITFSMTFDIFGGRTCSGATSPS